MNRCIFTPALSLEFPRSRSRSPRSRSRSPHPPSQEDRLGKCQVATGRVVWEGLLLGAFLVAALCAFASNYLAAGAGPLAPFLSFLGLTGEPEAYDAEVAGLLWCAAVLVQLPILGYVEGLREYQGFGG